MTRAVNGWARKHYPGNEARQELGLPRAVCEYEDVFLDEIPRLPSLGDVELTI